MVATERLQSALDHLIVALDVPSYAAAERVLQRLPQVTWWKVGLELYLSVGSPILELLHHHHKRIFLDLKLHDIPNTVEAATRIVCRHGIDFLTVHASGGIPMMQAAQTASQGTSCQIIGVTLLTSLAPDALHQHLRVQDSPLDYVEHLAQAGQQAGIPGVVCSPQEAPRLRQRCDPGLIIVTPGIRLAATADDQARICSPAQAHQSGVNFIVVGRPILQAKDPDAAVQAYAEDWLRGTG